MLIWKKVQLENIDRKTSLLSNALTNYIYKEGPIVQLFNKYNISKEDIKLLDNYTAQRIAGLIILFFSGDSKRINDIANKYNYLVDIDDISKIKPEIEGYVDVKRSDKNHQ